jgi:uncharacterized membrane protein
MTATLVPTGPLSSPLLATSKPFSSLLLGAAGGALLGARPRRSIAGALAALTGLALVGVAASGPMGETLRRVGTRRRAIYLRLSFVVPHPVTTVFRFFSDFENFPRLVRALREVEDFGDGRAHWVAAGVGGRILEWDSVTTKFVTNRVIAWQSTPSSFVLASCSVRLVPERDGGTCVKLAIDYSVPTDRIKDAVAALAFRRRTREIESDIRLLGRRLDEMSPVSPSTA